MTRPLCKNKCGNLTKLVEKGDKKRGIKGGSYRSFCSRECYYKYHSSHRKSHCDYGHTLTVKVVKGKERQYCRVCNTARRLARKTGMEFLDVLAREEGRGSLCEICRIRPADRYDHNHETNEFRGWLCNGCNSGLGQFGDNPEVLKRAYFYLKKRGHYGEMVG